MIYVYGLLVQPRSRNRRVPFVVERTLTWSYHDRCSIQCPHDDTRVIAPRVRRNGAGQFAERRRSKRSIVDPRAVLVLGSSGLAVARCLPPNTCVGATAAGERVGTTSSVEEIIAVVGRGHLEITVEHVVPVVAV